MFHLEIPEVVLVHFNIIKNKDSRVLNIFIPNKSFDQLLDISPTNLIFLKTFHSEFHKLKYGLMIKILHQYR